MYRWLNIRVRLVIILLITVTVPILVTGYFMMNQAETSLLNEKKAKLFGYAHLLDKHLTSTYDEILSRSGALNLDRDTKIQLLNQALRGYTDQVASTHPGIGIGYYSKELDAILTYGPSSEFSHTVGQSIFPGHQGYEVMSTGKEMVQLGALVRGPIMNCMVPVIRQGKIIGYIWSNELLEDIEAQIAVMEKKIYDTILIGLFFALSMAYFMTGSIARDVETIKNGLKILYKDMSYRLPRLRGEMGDITGAINEMSEALSNMKHHTENIVTSTPNGLITLNEQGMITIYNLPSERITGVPAREAIEKHYSQVFRQWPEFVEALDKAQGEDSLLNLELTFEGNLRQIPLFISISSLRSKKGVRMGLLVIFRDLTDTKKLEEQVRRADRLALIGELAAGVAHEVRNPLTAITGYLQLLSIDLPESDPRQEFTRIISKEISRLNSLIEQLLYFSRPLPPSFVTMDIHKVIQETILLLNNPSILKEVSIKKSFSSNLPHVKLDPVQFKQVLLNIMLNAIQSIESKGVVSIITDYLPSTSQVRIRIIDTGSGIPPENIPRLFDPFFTTKEKGTGLGLSVADKIMEVHGGHIEVTSETGKGSWFTIYLPANQEVNNRYA